MYIHQYLCLPPDCYINQPVIIQMQASTQFHSKGESASREQQQQAQQLAYECEALRETVQVQEREKGELQQIIVSLKKQLSSASRENSRLFQENERNRQLVEKLKIDNKSMEMELDKFKSERKIYHSNINNIELLKRELAEKMAEKNSLLDDTASRLRKMERMHLECPLRIQELEQSVRECEQERKQLRADVKDALEKYLAAASLNNRLQYELRDANDLNTGMRNRIIELERDIDDTRGRLGNSQQEEERSLEGSHGPHQRSMVEIQSYMKEIEVLLNKKRDEADYKRKNYEKLAISLDCLQKNL